MNKLGPSGSTLRDCSIHHRSWRLDCKGYRGRFAPAVGGFL